MKQFTHYNEDSALVLDFTGDRRWLVEPKGNELHLVPLTGPVDAAGTIPTTTPTPDGNARHIVLKFDKPGSLSALAIGADRVRKNVEDAAKVEAQYMEDLQAVADAAAKATALQHAFTAKYGK